MNSGRRRINDEFPEVEMEKNMDYGVNEYFCHTVAEVL